MIEAIICFYLFLGFAIAYGMREELDGIIRNSYAKAFLLTILCIAAWPLMIIMGIIKDKL